MTACIYMLQNSEFPALLKLGQTRDLKRRIAQHNSGSHVVGRWKLVDHVPVPTDKLDVAEQAVLRAFKRQRVPGKKEQFKITRLGDAKAKFRKTLYQWGTEFDAQRKSQARKARQIVADCEPAMAAGSEEYSRVVETVHDTTSPAVLMRWTALPVGILAGWVAVQLDLHGWALPVFAIGLAAMLFWAQVVDQEHQAKFQKHYREVEQKAQAAARAVEAKMMPHSHAAYDLAQKLIWKLGREGREY